MDKEQTRLISWTKSSQQERVDLEGHSKAVRSLDFQPESMLLASGSYDKNMIVQKLEPPTSHKLLHTLTGPVLATVVYGSMEGVGFG